MAKYGWVFVDTNILTSINGPTGSIQFRTANTEASGTYTAIYSTSSATVLVGSTKDYFDTYAHTLGNESLHVTGNVTISGTLEATQYHTNIVSSSIIYSSGSTKFGNSSDDIHQITGSAYYNHTLNVTGAADFASSVTAGTSFIIGSADLNEADLEKLDGITDGTAAANKAVVLDGSKNIATIGTIGCGAITSTGASTYGSLSGGALSGSSTLQVVGNTILGGTDASTVTLSGSLTGSKGKFDIANGNLSLTGTLDVGGAVAIVGNVDTDGTLTCDTSLTIDTTTISAAEIGVLDSVTAGTAAASKAVVLDGSKNVSTLGTVGAAKVSGSKGSFDMANGVLILTGSLISTEDLTITEVSGAKGRLDLEFGVLALSGNIDAGGTLSCDTSFTIDTTTISAAEIGVLDGVTAGTAAANKALVVDGSKHIGTLGTITAASITGSKGKFAMTTGTIITTGSMTLGKVAPNNGGSLVVEGSASLQGPFTGSEGAAFPDGKPIFVGTAGDLLVYHDGTNSYIKNNTGNLIFLSDPADKDIRVRLGSDNNNTAFQVRNDSNSNIFKVFGSGKVSGSGPLDIEGDIRTTGSLIVGDGMAVSLNATDLAQLDGISPGTAAADKCVIVDGNLAIAGLRGVTGSTFTALGGFHGDGSGLTGVAAGTATNISGAKGRFDTTNGNLIVTGTLAATGVSTLGSITGSMGRFDLANGNLIFSGSIHGDGSTLTGISATNITGAKGQFNTTNGNLIVTGSLQMVGFEVEDDGDVVIADDATIGNATVEDFITMGADTITIKDGSLDFNIASHDGSNGLKLGGTLVAATAAQLNFNQGVTLGTAIASKTVTLDGNKAVTGIQGLTASTVTTTSGLVSVGDFSSTSDTATFTSANADDPLVLIKNTTNDATGGRLRFVKDKGAAGAAGDIAGIIEFVADDANQDQVMFASITGSVAVHTNGQEGGKLQLSVASHDGELQNGLVIIDGSAEDEVDVIIGNGAASLTTVAGDLQVDGDTSTFQSSNNNDPLIVVKNTANHAGGGRLRFVNDKGAAGADNDVAGAIEFYADDDNQDNIEFARIEGIVADASNGAEGGKLVIQVATHDGELQPGLTIIDGSAEDEVDVTVGNGAASVVTVPGLMDIAGAVDIAGDLTLSAGADGALTFGVASSVKIPDNEAASLVIEEANNAYMTFVTSNSSERVKISQHTTIIDDTKLYFGDGEDWSIEYDEDGNDDLKMAGTTFTMTTDTATFTSANANDPLVQILNTTNDANGGTLRLVNDKGAAGADDDICGQIQFYGDDDNQDNIEFAAIIGQVADASNGAEGGRLVLRVATHDGEMQSGLTIQDGDAEDELDVIIASGGASNTTISGDLTVSGDTVLFGPSTAADDPLVEIKNTRNDATGGRLRFTKDKGAAGAAGDVAGSIEWYADDANQDQVLFAAMTGSVAVHTNGQEGGKLTLSVASHDGELQNGIVVIDGNGEDRVDVTIGNGAASTQTCAGSLDVTADLTTTGNAVTFSSATANKPLVQIKNTTNDAASALLRFVKDKGAAGADNDIIGKIEFYGDDDNQDNIEFASIIAQVADASNGAEGGRLVMQIASHDGEMANGLTISDGGSEDAVNVVVGNSNNGCVIQVDSDTGIQFNHPAVSGYQNDTGAGDILRDGGGSLTAGKLYFMPTGSTNWTEVDASTDQSGSGQLLGIALGSSATTNGLLIRGFFDAHTYLSGAFKSGSPVYMSTGGGYMQIHPPSGSDEQLRVVGHCTSTGNVIYFNPSSTWIEIS
jgi:hypothetical protein